MALLDVDLFSESLEMGTSLSVVLPQSTRAQIGVEAVPVPDHGWPVLYLLHGLSDDHTAWVRYTSIERYATAAGVAVVMPAVARSFYADEPHGHAYWAWVSEELPQRVAEMFRLSTRPQDTYVAGLSMGGYGAVRLGLTHPERYAAVASLSGALDLVGIVERPDRDDLVRRLFADGVPEEANLFSLLEQAASVPPMHLSCGTSDELLADTESFAAAAREHGADVTVDLRPGDHEWGLWDAVVADVIGWLPRTG